ncbi:MAG: nicotinate (nicotinamide) nucleotide adenylyltransferase [Bacilli bacterium]
MKTLIFGGSFDPIHNGHLQILDKACSSLGIDRVIIIPARAPRWKKLSSTTDEQRIQMIKLAIEGKKNYSICYDELNSSDEINYTFNTISHLKREDDEELYFLIGFDQLDVLDKWYEIDKLSKMIKIVSIARPNYQIVSKNVEKYGVIVIDEEISDMSSSALRELNNLSCPKKVLDYIAENELYYIPTLKEYMSNKRFNHTLSVSNLAYEIALRNNIDPYKAYHAALLHDVGKEISEKEQENYVKEYFLNLYGHLNKALYHQFVSEAIARDKFKIKDEEILNAIKFHATGCSNMSALAMIVYSADKIEPTRGYDSSDLIEACYKDYYRGFKAVLKANIEFLEETHKEYQNPLTNSCIASYLEKLK